MYVQCHINLLIIHIMYPKLPPQCKINFNSGSFFFNSKIEKFSKIKVNLIFVKSNLIYIFVFELRW